MEPPSTFTLTLRPYQKQALSWMSKLETGSESGREESLHPLWQQCAPANLASLRARPSADSSYTRATRWQFNLSPEEMQGPDGAGIDIDDFPDRACLLSGCVLSTLHP